MGLFSLLAMLETSDDIEETVRWHLSSNCYPPLPEAYVPMCVEAIRASKCNLTKMKKLC